MLAKYFPYKQGGVENWLQTSMRPIQLWEVCFPRDHLQTVLNTVGAADPPQWQFKPLVKTMRAMLGAKKIPKFDTPGLKKLVFHDNVAIYAIGIKDDKDTPDGDEQV